MLGKLTPVTALVCVGEDGTVFWGDVFEGDVFEGDVDSHPVANEKTDIANISTNIIRPNFLINL